MEGKNEKCTLRLSCKAVTLSGYQNDEVTSKIYIYVVFVVSQIL